MDYRIVFVHSTMYGEGFLNEMNKIMLQPKVVTIKVIPPTATEDEVWDDFEVIMTLKVDKSIDALISGLVIMKQLMTEFGIDTFAIVGPSGFRFTEENL